jgi:hypothetical protein
LGTFWLKIEQFWSFEAISIFSNGGHLELRMALTDTILKGTLPRTIPGRFSATCFSGFRGEDLNVILYQNMPNLHNRYKSAERKMSSNFNCSYMAMSSLAYIYSGVFCEIFLSADLYRLCKIGIF